MTAEFRNRGSLLLSCSWVIRHFFFVIELTFRRVCKVWFRCHLSWRNNVSSSIRELYVGKFSADLDNFYLLKKGSMSGRPGFNPQRLKKKKRYSIPPGLTLSNIRYVLRVKETNPGKGVAPFPTLQCNPIYQPLRSDRIWHKVNF